MMNLMVCWLLAVFQGGRAICDFGGGRENHDMQAGGCSIANLLAVQGKKISAFSLYFLGQILA